MANTQNLKGIRCPMCFETNGFVIQLTMNLVMHDDGYDAMGTQIPDDHFPGRVIDDNDGLNDEDPITCANRNGCEHRGTVGEFREIERANELQVA
jgi:hypothetical protein